MISEQEAHLLGELKGLRDGCKLFCSRMSGDLSGSLRNIRGFASLLEGQSGAHFDDKSRQYLSFLKEGTDKARALLEGLTEYFDLLGEERVLSTVSVEESLKGALEDLEPEFKRLHAVVTTKLCPVEIFGDVMLLRKAFRYILENSLLYSKGVPRISITFERKMAQYVISISDEGIGIPSPFENIIFEPFKRLHSIDQYPGVGLGLTLVKRIVEMHHGRIWVEPNEKASGGTTVFCSLPLRA